MKFKECRKASGETQEAIAKIIGITRGAYANIEIGKREPDFATLFILADHYGVSIDYLLGHATPEEEKQRRTVPISGDSLDPAFAARYSRLDAIDQAKVAAFVEGLLAADKYAEKKEKRA